MLGILSQHLSHSTCQPNTHLTSPPTPLSTPRVTWLATSLLTLLKDRSERMLGSTRDLLYIFLLFVAFKVDDPMAFTWKVVFLIPWMWFSALALLSVMVSNVLFHMLICLGGRVLVLW